MTRRPEPRQASVPVATRLPERLHAAVVEAAKLTGASPGTWLQDLAADHLGIALTPRSRTAPRRRHQAPADRQLGLRTAVASLGALGVAVVEVGLDDALAADIRSALAVVVAAVAPSR